MTVFDIETTNKADLILIGVMTDGKYHKFTTSQDFVDYLKRNKIREVFAHNLEYDFFKLIEYLPHAKFCGYYSTAGLCYVQMGSIYFKDTYNHLRYSLAYIGKQMGLEKIEPDYNKVTKLTPYLVQCNKNHCQITYRIVEMLREVYYDVGHCEKIKSTIGSQALEIYAKRFKCCNLKLLDRSVLDIWRKGYGGGWCEVFKRGKFTTDVYYKIDVNSLYPFIMQTSYPYPFNFRKVSNLSELQRNYTYWLGVLDGKVYNSVEHREMICSYYYLFGTKIYPFKAYVMYFYNKKRYARGLKKQIYKILLNSLYGKFAQRNEVDVVSNYKYTNTKNIYYQEQIVGDLYRIKFTNQSKIWVNVLWSLFTTAKARQYMRNIKRYCEAQGMTVYYTDTDSFILSGPIDNIRTIIDDTKLGQFKIEDMTNSMDIRGKKFYEFGGIYKCKGVPLAYRKEFFDKGIVEFKKMVKYKEALRRNLKIGTMITTKKENLKNKA